MKLLYIWDILYLQEIYFEFALNLFVNMYCSVDTLVLMLGKSPNKD